MVMSSKVYWSIQIIDRNPSIVGLYRYISTGSYRIPDQFSKPQIRSASRQWSDQNRSDWSTMADWQSGSGEINDETFYDEFHAQCIDSFGSFLIHLARTHPWISSSIPNIKAKLLIHIRHWKSDEGASEKKDYFFLQIYWQYNTRLQDSPYSCHFVWNNLFSSQAIAYGCFANALILQKKFIIV